MLKEITVASAVAALFVLSGCGSSSSGKGGGNPPDTGIEIPSELKQKADVNDGVAGKIYHKLYQNMYRGSSVSSKASNSKLAFSNLLNNKIALKPADLGGDDEENINKSYNCSNEGGTYTIKREITETSEDDMNVLTTIIECSANNCEMNRDDYDDNETNLRYCTPQEDLEVGSINPQMPDYTVTYNGSIKVFIKEAESADVDAYSYKGTLESISEAKNMSMIFHIIGSDSEDYRFSNGKASNKEEYIETAASDKYKTNMKMDYIYKMLNRKVSNHAQIEEGKIVKSKFDLEITQEEDDSKIKRYGRIDGYHMISKVSGSESNKTLLPNSSAYDNFTFEKIIDGDKSEYNLNGGINDSFTCYSMYYITTDNIVKHNKTYQVSVIGRNDILPYEGKVTLESNGVAVATFNVDEDNKTSMRLEIDDELIGTYGKWSEVPNNDCDDE